VAETCICGKVHEGEQPPHATEVTDHGPEGGGDYYVLAGENIQEGIVGFGATPEEACAEFDREWREVARG
jgi:hypothetical protein